MRSELFIVFSKNQDEIYLVKSNRVAVKICNLLNKLSIYLYNNTSFMVLEGSDYFKTHRFCKDNIHFTWQASLVEKSVILHSLLRQVNKS
jgi:hypothetical protein